MDQSSCTSSTPSSALLNCMPQHLDAMDSIETISSGRERRTTHKAMAAIIATVSLVSMIPSTAALSFPAATSAGARSLVDQARMIRELKISGETLDYLQPSMDNDAWSAALFDESFTNGSLEKAVVASASTGSSSSKRKAASSDKQLAEQYDRFMEEDISVSSIIHDNLKPGSLVDDVKNSKGADVDMEHLLQMKARERRAKVELMEETTDKLTKVLVTDHQKKDREPTVNNAQPVTNAYNLAKARTSSKSANKDHLLSRDQEYELARTIQRGAQIHKLKAEYESSHQEQLTKRDWAHSNMGLVHAVVNNQYRRKAFKQHRGEITMDELVQEGSLGLIRAAELFDPEKGLRFSTYATIWIKGVLSNSSMDDDIVTLPSRERVIWNKIRRAWDDMKAAGEEAPLSRRDKKRVEESIQRMQCVGNVLSLDYQYTSSTRSGYADGRRQEGLMSTKFFSEDADLAERAQLKADLVAALVRNLDERELQLIRLRYGLHDGQEYTIKECAAKMEINRETARLLQHACLKKLREASNMESLQEYLLTVA
ncbi:RNA polymerase sigma factor [Skeletonema marinoi]|uniref:RNA polymerase sigma factor n=1 Tax=Skeletonema marinoi TaxID=267567 RepID=A0AAD9D7V4_9STRA|nr:RNA polymerase sigma factor [Skeletonema marinoi]